MLLKEHVRLLLPISSSCAQVELGRREQTPGPKERRLEISVKAHTGDRRRCYRTRYDLK